MGRFFDLDSPVMRFLSKVADLMILNIITLICCIPIITIGAAMTGLHYVLLKMVRNEEGYIIRSFFKSFKENFKQATIIWMIILLFFVIFIGDIMIFNYSGITFHIAIKVILIALAILVCMLTAYVFPVLARYDNSVKNTLKNGFLMSILSFPKTILMLILYALPTVALYFIPASFPVVFMFGFAAPAYVAAMLYNGTFKRFEPEEEPLSDHFEILLEDEEPAEEEEKKGLDS